MVLDLERLEKMYKTNYEEMVGFAKKWGFNGNAEDFVQDAFVKMVEKKDKFEGDEKGLRLWAYKIIKNGMINQYRKKKSFVTLEEAFNLSVPSFEEEIENKELIRMLSKKNKDSEDFRFLFLSESGFKYKEIAKISGRPLGTVKPKIFNAKNKSKKQIENYLRINNLYKN